ncbi:MAG: DUF4837 family protein [Bacteroidaceae bacterium]|nr:DUF4837 family protein [Bacteroidaceae bacterium]MBR1467901.1 DUF4837 family protein [Bacteroidaceae bacterium]
MRKTLLTLLLGAVVLAGCTKENLFPVASGRPYEVLVVMDSVEWNAPHGRALFDVLDTDVPMLPQSERSFRISQTERKDFDRVLNIFRNIIIVNIDERQFTKTKMKFTRDKYAMEQIVLTINSPSREEFRVFCTDHREEIVDFLVKMEMNRLVVELKKKFSKKTFDLAKQIFGCEMYAPDELTSYKKGKDFLWTTNNTATGLESIVMYSFPYDGPESFNKEYLCAKRDSVMKVNLPGEKPGMYMQTDTLCTVVKPIAVHGKYAMEMRGLWFMRNDCMGGPYVSHARVDTEANRVVVVEGFVYAPEKMKRGLIRRLEGSLYTLRLPEEQFVVAITPTIEEDSEKTDK